MTRIFLRYQLDKSAIWTYTHAVWGDSSGFPIKRALDTIMEWLTKKDGRITLNVDGDFTDPKFFPEEFTIGRPFEGDETYTTPIRKLVDMANDIELAVKNSVIPYNLANSFIENQNPTPHNVQLGRFRNPNA